MDLIKLLHTAVLELDLLTFLIAGVGTAICNVVLSANQTLRPHFLADATLWHEFRGHTVPIVLLFSLLVFVEVPVIFLIEFFLLSPLRKLKPQRRLLTSLRFALGALTMTMINLVFVEAGKNYVGYLRPSFARSCVGEAAFQALGADALTPKSAPCTGSGFESRRSFPSGHTSLAVGMGLYLQLYIMRAARARPLIAMVSYLPMGAALFVSASRIVDNAHHPADVVAGAFLGMWPALTHFWYVSSETEAKERSEQANKENGLIERRSD